MKKNKVTRTLAGFNKGVFKALNQGYGFNFEKPFEAIEIKTPFTLNTAIKALSDRFNDAGMQNGDLVVIMIHFPENYFGWMRNKLVPVHVIGTGAGDFNISYSGSIEYPYRHALNTLYRKGDFNDARKDSEVKAYIIAQKAEFRAKCHQYPNEYKGNYTERDTKHAGDSYQNGRYVNGERVYETVLRVDKSGYRVELKRDELKRSAKELHDKRQKEAFLATDNTARIEELKKRADIAKTIIVERLSMATTENAIYDVRNHGMYELCEVFRYLERLEAGEKEKSFSSIDSFNSTCDSVERSVKKILAWNFF